MSAVSRSKVPDYNFVPELISEHMPREVVITDVTLRDGEQQMEAAFSRTDKIATAVDLSAAGIQRIQVGYPEADAETVKQLKREGLPTKFELYNDASSPRWKQNIDASLEAGADVLHFEIRSKDEVLAATGLNRAFVLDRVASCVDYARHQGGAYVVFGSTHFTQTSLAFILQLYRLAATTGANELVLNDTLGVTKPAAMAYLVKKVRETSDLPIRVHCHDDFGLAVASSLASIEAGASRVDVCVNGLGERGGNASLEEVVMGCERLLGVKTHIELSMLTNLSRTVAERLHMPIPTNKSVVGANAFAQKLDGHVAVAESQPHLFEPYGPEIVGARRVIRLGKCSGPFAVRNKLRELSLTERLDDDEFVSGLVDWVNQYAEAEKTYVDDALFEMHVNC